MLFDFTSVDFGKEINRSIYKSAFFYKVGLALIKHVVVGKNNYKNILSAW